MKILDKYIIRKFLGTFFFTMSLIILIVLVIDLAEKVDDFIEKKAPMHAILVDYYLNFIPYYVSLLSPLFIFIAVIYFTAQLATRSEIIAILGSGISYRRFLVPYFIGALIIAALNFILAAFVVPPCHKRVEAFEDTYVRSEHRQVSTKVYLRKAPGLFVTIEAFNISDSIGYQFTTDYFIGIEKIYRLTAERIAWDSKRKLWRLDNYTLRKFSLNGENVEWGYHKDTVLQLSPDEFTAANRMASTLNYFELDKEIKDQKTKGTTSLDGYLVEKYKRISSSFAMFVLTLLGVAIAARKVRGGVGIHLGLGLFISFTFLLLNQFSLTFGVSGQVDPLLAVWIPNMVYAVLGVVIAIKAPK